MPPQGPRRHLTSRIDERPPLRKRKSQDDDDYEYQEPPLSDFILPDDVAPEIDLRRSPRKHKGAQQPLTKKPKVTSQRGRAKSSKSTVQNPSKPRTSPATNNVSGAPPLSLYKISLRISSRKKNGSPNRRYRCRHLRR
jgi:hypothetical protein